MRRWIWIMLVVLLAVTATEAQRRRTGGFGGWGGGGEGIYVPDETRTAREVPTHSRDANGNHFEIPHWTNAPGFDKDVFTFVRIKRLDRRWTTDTPDSDLNLSWRLTQMTSLKVNPDGRYLRLTEKELSHYPFIYMVEPGGLYLEDDEIVALRKYLLNGGFLWLDDFWGEEEWRRMASVLKQVFQDRSFVELDVSHPIYHCVFDIKAKHQVPSIGHFYRGRTSERGYDSQDVHHRAIYDDKGRMMVLATHNTDNGDGWEREGENTEYFEQHSEKTAYPLAINVVFYVMTH